MRITHDKMLLINTLITAGVFTFAVNIEHRITKLEEHMAQFIQRMPTHTGTPPEKVKRLVKGENVTHYRNYDEEPDARLFIGDARTDAQKRKSIGECSVKRNES